MKIKKILLISTLTTFLIVTVFLSSIMDGSASAGEDDITTDQGLDREVTNNAFGIGEKLTFDVGYGFINAGYAIMEIEDLIEYNERPCYLIKSTANSNQFFSTFYRVEDKVESIIDARGIYSWYFEKNLSEGKYRAQQSYSFDQESHRVFFEKDTLEVASYVQDALSVLYYVRTQNLEIGQSVYIDNFTDGKQYPLEVKVIKKETVSVKAGKFDCIVVEPLLLSSGIFKHEGRLKVWLTDDRLKMPVLMKSKVLVGSISAELTEYQLGEIVEF